MRAAEFDRSEVLQSAMNAFIAKGYSKTSMQDLKKATGLHPGSIYCAFESKKGLLMAALDHYSHEQNRKFDAYFSHAPSIREGFLALFDSIVSECECNGIKDCLLQKSLGDITEDDEEVSKKVDELINASKHRLYARLIEAQQTGEIANDTDCVFLCEYLTMNIYGLRSYAHTTPAPGILRQLANAVVEKIR